MLDYKFNYDKKNKKLDYCNLNNTQIHYLNNNNINNNLNNNKMMNNVINNIICKDECLDVSCNKCFLKYSKDSNFLEDINIKNNLNEEFCKKKSNNIINECKNKEFYKQKRIYANINFFKSI